MSQTTMTVTKTNVGSNLTMQQRVELELSTKKGLNRKIHQIGDKHFRVNYWNEFKIVESYFVVIEEEKVEVIKE